MDTPLEPVLRESEGRSMTMDGLMNWDVIEVKVTGEYTLWVRFQDDVQGTVHCLPTFFRGIFSRLCDPLEFRQVMLEDGVVTWPGNLDLAPDAMHDQIKANGEWVLT